MPYEAELRARIRRAEQRAALYESLAQAQQRIIRGARAALLELARSRGPGAPQEQSGLQAERKAAGERSRVAIVAIRSHPAGDERWQFDFADDFGAAYEKLRQWNERARREWPDLRFSLAMTRLP